MSGSVPLPQGQDLQIEGTQSLIQSAKAVQEVFSEMIAAGQRAVANKNNSSEHQLLWNKYSKGVEAESPIQTSLAVARNALKAGETQESVEKILTHDPQFAEINKLQGIGKAQDYAKTVTRAAVHREQKAQPGQQQFQQRRIGRTRSKQIALSP